METSENTKSVSLGNEGQASLEGGLCPYCDADLEEYMLFGGSDGREGGFAFCRPCGIRFAWIDSPFECEIQEEV